MQMREFMLRFSYIVMVASVAAPMLFVATADARTWEPRRHADVGDRDTAPEPERTDAGLERRDAGPELGRPKPPSEAPPAVIEPESPTPLRESEVISSELRESEVPRAYADRATGDVPPRRLIRHRIGGRSTSGDRKADAAIGAVAVHRARPGETFLDIARERGLGYNELLAANRSLDPWVLPVGAPVVLPSEWLLPEGTRQGVILNIPEMRLYYFLGGDEVITFAVGLGRQDWQTPRGSFRIRGKTANPTWVIPESIRKERFEADGLTETMIPGGRADNPLGKYRLELTLPSYAIHGTNKQWGVGMQVSHGCVRLYPEDIEALFPVIPVGTPGAFVYQPVKVGRSRGRVLIEVHEDIYGVAPDSRAAAEALLAKKGLRGAVDDALLEAALRAVTGIPTDIGPVAAPAGVARKM